MAQKPRSRKHEDRLCKLECDLANLADDVHAMLNKLVLPTEPPRTFWQKLNDYFAR